MIAVFICSLILMEEYFRELWKQLYFICCPVALSFQLHLSPGLETHTTAISFLELMALAQTHSLRCAVFNPDSLLFQMLHLASAALSKSV